MKYLCCVASVIYLLSSWGKEANAVYKGFGEWANAISPLGVWRCVESNGTERSFLVCPKTCKVYEIIRGHVDVSKSVEIDPTRFARMYLPTNRIDGIVGSDMVGFVRIQIKKGENSFDYPYDLELQPGFKESEILAEPFDGDFVSYMADGRQFAACATFANDGMSIRWHDPQTFEVIMDFPRPDPDKELCYYRRQGTNTSISISGGVKLKGPSFYSYHEHGILRANQLLGNRTIKRKSWRSSLLGGYIKWTDKFAKTSIRDPRRFYVRLKDGRKAFAMIQEDHKHLVSPITHALLTIPKSDIVCFEPITDNAYKEEQCFSRSEVEELWRHYQSNEGKGVSKWWLLLLAGVFFVFGKVVDQLYDEHSPSIWGVLARHKCVKAWFIVLVFLLALIAFCVD